MDAALSPRAAALLDEERTLLGRILELMVRLEARPELRDQLADLIRNLDDLFLVVVVGEFNAGKSSVLNALFGERLLEEGPIPTTDKITILRQGDESGERQRSDYLVERRIPSDLLEHLTLVDTPGTNSIVRQHQTLTEEFIPRADLILFITSYDRPLSESERQFLSFIREDWGKRLIVILNKADLAREDEAKLDQVVNHIRSGFVELMGFEPRIFPVSAELALAAKTADTASVHDALWPKSGFEPLERFIRETLAGEERLTLKLTAPLDSAARISAGLERLLSSRSAQLEADAQTLTAFDVKLEEDRSEFVDGYQRYLAEVDNALLEMERRGVQFLEDNIRIGKLSLLRDKDAFREEFARQVVRDHEHDIEERLGEGVDWFLRRLLALWNWTLNHFAEKAPRAGATSPRGSFDYNRTEVFESVMRQARRRIDTYDLNEEARRILNNARNAAALFLGTEAVAGLGVLVTLLIVAAGVDVTGGLIASGIVAVLGLVFLPRQRRKAVDEFRERIDGMRSDMKRTLAEQFDRELDLSAKRLEELVAPYRTFVETQSALLAESTEELEAVEAERQDLRNRVTRAFGETAI